MEETETPTIAPVPDGWKRTSRKPFAMGGLVWRSYRRGVNLYGLVAEVADCQCIVYRNNGTSATFTATIDKKPIGQLYRSEYSACEAIGKVLKHLK